MNKYTKPEMTIVSFETINIIATSGDSAGDLQTWGSNLKSVDSDEVVDMFG